MARSYGVLKVSVWEPGSEFRRLSPLAQWTYTMLLSQPQVSNLGVLPYTPEKWARFAAGLDREQLEQAIAELAEQQFVIVDDQVGELLVRTFIKHDKVWSQPKLVTNARKLIREVESAAIHTYLSMRHPWLLDDRPKAEIEAFEADAERGIETPSDRGIADTPSRTPSDTRFPPARAQDVRASRAPAGAGPGSGVGAAAEVQEENLELELGEPAAAELEAPRQADIDQAVQALNDHDRATRGVVEPLARTVPAIVFRDVVERTQQRIANGSVANHTGLFVDLLRKASKDYRASLARAAEHVQVTPLSDVVSDARFYAPRIPWAAAEELIVRKLTRLQVADDERIEILDAAADAYHDASKAHVST